MGEETFEKYKQCVSFTKFDVQDMSANTTEKYLY